MHKVFDTIMSLSRVFSEQYTEAQGPENFFDGMGKIKKKHILFGQKKKLLGF